MVWPGVRAPGQWPWGQRVSVGLEAGPRRGHSRKEQAALEARGRVWEARASQVAVPVSGGPGAWKPEGLRWQCQCPEDRVWGSQSISGGRATVQDMCDR